ncbi:spherulation-specific family 4 protein [Demequina flava]|uniref:spherulation-specific family 4 protein n=1 Tax=Demequina flava TaxID=1095025 RepID=UPI000782C749|nr:spherulation-specific family 4 protein [Demequina flava]
MTHGSAVPQLAVPAYFHPATHPVAWRELLEIAPMLRFVIVNIHNGPGTAPDPGYPAVIRALHAASVRTVGYVDTDYGLRATDDVAADVRAYQSWYGLRGVFFDQVATGLNTLDHYAQCVVSARSLGARFVVLNPGTEPHPGYLDLANVTVTFEGSWSEYEHLCSSEWMSRFDESRICHLVHSMPTERIADRYTLASRSHVGSVFFTDGSGTNPWDHIPQELTVNRWG